MEQLTINITPEVKAALEEQGKSKDLGAHASSVPRSDSTINIHE